MDTNPGPASTTAVNLVTPTVIPGIFTFATLPSVTAMTGYPSGTTAFTSDEGPVFWNGSAWQVISSPGAPTAAEISLGIVPTNLTFPVGRIERYGGDPLGVVESTTAVNNCIKVVNSSGGGVVDVSGTFLVNTNSATIDGFKVLVNLKSNVVMRGRGPSTGFKSTVTGLRNWILGSSGQSNFGVENLQITGPTTSVADAVAIVGISAASHDCWVKNCFLNTGYIGVFVGNVSTTSSYSVEIGGNEISNIGVDGIGINSFGNDFWVHDNFVYNAGVSATTGSSFTAKIDNGSGGVGNILNVSAVSSGTIQVGGLVTGTGVTAQTVILPFGTGGTTGSGSTGTYIVSISQAITSEAMTIAQDPGAGIEFRGGIRGTIANNIFRDMNYNAAGAVDGIRLEYATEGATQQVQNVAVTGNVVSNYSGHGIQLHYPLYCSVTGNTITGNSTCQEGILLNGNNTVSKATSYCTISGNTIRDGTTNSGISIQGDTSNPCLSNNITGNTIKNCGYGSYLSNHTDTLYVGNIINTTTNQGIYHATGTNTTISANKVSLTGSIGIQLVTGDRVQLIGNIVRNAAAANQGIFIAAAMTNTVVNANVSHDNGGQNYQNAAGSATLGNTADASGTGFFGAQNAGQGTITGNRQGNAALASLLTTLGTGWCNLVNDTTTSTLTGLIVASLRATAIEQRSSTTTLTNSTQLTFAVPAAGTYEFEICVFSYFTTAVTDGITANVNYSGTFTAVGSYIQGYLMNGTTTTTGIQPVQISATVNNALTGLTMSTYGASVSSTTPAVHFMTGNLIATAAGTLAFAFAQSTSGVDTANLGVGSYMTVTQLS